MKLGSYEGSMNAGPGNSDFTPEALGTVEGFCVKGK